MPDLTWLIGLITPAEWQAVLWLMLLIYSVTEVVKRIYRAFTRRYSRNEIWLVAFVVGLVGAFFIWPDNSEVWWWVAGLCAGPMSNVLHTLGIGMLARFAPELAATLTGERRKRNDPPPGGIERRQGEAP